MPDYKEMYLHMVRETEKALRILIEAQRTCEELYLQEADAVQTAPSCDASNEPLPKAQ